MTRATLADNKIQKLVKELCNMVRQRFPEAEFEVYEGYEPRGVYIHAYTQADDFLGVMDVVSTRMAEIIEEEGVIVAVIPLPMKKDGNAAQ